MLSLVQFMIFIQIMSGQSTTFMTLSGESVTLDTLSSHIEMGMEELNMAGLSFALIQNNQVRYSKNFGYQNWDNKMRITPNTLFEAASMSKPVFAWLVMKLVENGLIELDKPLYQYYNYPDIAHDNKHKKITARLVLTHQTGLPNWRYNRPLSIGFEPGADFSYSGEGFVYLGKVIEHILEMSLEEIMQKEVFRPLKMENSSMIWSPENSLQKASGHYNGNVPSTDYYRPLQANPAASLLTTVEDFTKFMIAVLNQEGLKKSSYDEMFKIQVTPKIGNSHQNEKGTINWGVGWVLEKTPHGIKAQHGGNNGDFESYFELSLDKKMGYVYFTNTDKGDEFNKILKPFLTNYERIILPNSNLSSDYEIDFSSATWDTDEATEHLMFKGKSSIAFLSQGEAVLNSKFFKNSIIEFDVLMPEGYCNAGVKFRRSDEDNYENFYLRSHESGTNQALQYTPVFNGNTGWQLHGGYNYRGRTLHFRDGEWMHVKMAIFDDWMEVFIDDMDNLALHVFDLKHPVKAGSIALWSDSPAYFANFKAKEVETYDFYYNRQPKPIPPTGTITSWNISNGFHNHELNDVAPAEKFVNTLTWEAINCEYNGLVNISKKVKLSKDENTVIGKAIVISDKEQRKRLQFGYSDIGKIFLNRKIIYDGQRIFQSRDPSYWGTIGYFESIYLDLKEGENELWFVVTENFGGWGMMAKFDNIEGIEIKN